MPHKEPILTAQHYQQDFAKFTPTRDEFVSASISNRSAPYIALALGLYENHNNPIQFAIDHLDQINDPNQSDNFSNISKVYSVLEVYADQLGSQSVITLPQLAALYGIAKKLSDEKIAKAVLISLTARHLSFKAGISHCQPCHIADAKNIIAATCTYFRQEATVDATVYMVSSLCREPDNYQLAANQGSSAELKKLSGAKIFSVKNQNKVNSIRLLLIAAQNIALETEEKKLDDAYIIFTVKQELLKQGVEEKLANAISIVVGAAYFIEENNSIPQQTHLEQAAELLIKSEATINYQANQAFAIKLLQEYMRPQAKTADAILAAKQLKQDLLSGKSIEGQIKSKGRLAELSWEALTLVQDYAANYYFSLTDGAFKIERTNQGNGLYAAVLKSIQGVFIDEPDHPAHKLTPEQLAINIRKLLPNAKGIIVKQFNDIIYNNASILSVPATFADGLKTLQQNWQCREELSLEEKKSLQEDITNYLRDISTYYIAFVNNNPTIGSDIELQIIAHYYDLQIKLHSHVADNYKIINPDAKSMAHIFCALHQSRYHSLIIQKDLKLQQEPLSQLAYIEQAAMAAEQGRAARYLETAIGILAQNNPVVWQSNKAINQESLVQTIKDVFKQTKVVVLEDLKERTKEKFKKTTTIDREPIQVPREYPLLLPLRQPEQLSIITKEAEVNIANIHLIVAQQAESLLRSKRTKVNYLKATLQDANAKAVIAFKLFGDAQKALYKVRHTAGLKEHGDALFEHSKTMHMVSLKALGIATIEAYHEWWQNIIQEQLTAIETSFSATDKQITQYIEALTKAYEQQLTAVDNHYAAVLNKAIQDYNYHQRCVAEEERTAKRKRRQGMYRAFAGMAIAAFVAPHMASSLFAPGIGCTIATGAIAGGISSGIAGGNVLKGAAMAGLFAGFGFAVDGVLGGFITNNELLRESLNVAATASLSTAIYGGKVLDNVFISIGANAVAALIVPMPKFANKELTIQQANAINNRQVMRAFTRGITALAISKNSNLGTSLMIAGMSSLQTWVSHQANTFIQERRAIEQQANTVNPRSRLAIGDKQPALQPTLFTNTAGSRFNKLGYIGKGKFGGYKINLPEIQHPCAGGLQPRMPATNRPLTGVPSSSWRRFQENYTAVTNDMDIDALMYNIQSQQMSQLYDDYQVGGRIGSGIQAGFGAGQLGVAAALAETGVGVVPACLLAARGADNLVTGAMGFITGQDRPTILHQGLRRAGLSDTAARWVEFGVDLSPVASGMAREAGNIAKGGVLKLYDLRNANIKNIRFNSEADPLLEILGHAKVSHPKEYNFIMQDLKNHAVNVQHRDGSIAFSPHTRGGTVGNTIYLPEEFSISALKHEYGHFVDHKNLGFPRHIEYFKNPQLIIATERKQYLAEIKLARELGDYNARKILTRNYLAEKEDIISKYYQQPYGHSSNNAAKLRGNS